MRVSSTLLSLSPWGIVSRDGFLENSLREILALALAGAAGSVSRFALSRFTNRILGDKLPYGTLLVNFIGSLLLGVIMGLALNSTIIPRVWRVPLTVGFFGAFTTFSTFSFETITLLEKGAWSSAIINIALNLLLCLTAAWLGLAIGRTVSA
jgi:CrcB protein